MVKTTLAKLKKAQAENKKLRALLIELREEMAIEYNGHRKWVTIQLTRSVWEDLQKWDSHVDKTM